ncbi:MAG: trypsin-like serine protease [bacterium]|nr:trypsin-like serine protease [bacterium]
MDRRQRHITVVASLAAGVFALVLLGLPGEVDAFSAAEVYRGASNSVVLIFAFEEDGSGSSGTGSILTSDGLVLTNNHVIVHGEGGGLYSTIVVYLKPNPISGDNKRDLTTPLRVDVVARDVDLDLALLRVKDAPGALRPIEIGDSEEVDIGEDVAAIGHPGGGGLWTLTTGTVSSKRREQARDIFQTDAAINPGNSGGPLLDEHARLVGVNTFVRRVNAQGLPLEGLNYSLRSSLALRWVNRQGVTRVATVARSAVAAEAPAASRPAPVRPAPPAPRVVPDRPVDPSPAQVEPSPAPPLGLAPETEPEAREFTAPDGTKMYGVPNMENDLHEALQHARKEYADVLERSEASVRDLEDAFDDYDNF